jgi:OOP family OmpA-OmpF porin
VSGSESGKRYGIDALYHLGGGPFYGIFGLKNLDAVDEDLMFANVGAGYQHYFTDNFAFNAETSLYQGLDRGYTDVGAKLGISYIFGDQSAPAAVEPAPVVAAPTDSDNDGVMDADDQCANTPMTDAVDSKGCTLYEEKEATITLLVTFPHDVAEVPNKYFSDIADVAAFMKENEGTSVVLEGHASAVGDADYNMMLSEKRAKDVAEELVKDGISSDRISTVGYGEERLKNEAYTLEAHAQNRRVEAQITSIEKVKVMRK